MCFYSFTWGRAMDPPFENGKKQLNIKGTLTYWNVSKDARLFEQMRTHCYWKLLLRNLPRLRIVRVNIVLGPAPWARICNPFKEPKDWGRNVIALLTGSKKLLMHLHNLPRYRIVRVCIVLGLASWARICKPFKEPKNRFPAWRSGTTILFDWRTGPPGYIKNRLAESISWNRCLKRLQIRAQYLNRDDLTCRYYRLTKISSDWKWYGWV